MRHTLDHKCLTDTMAEGSGHRATDHQLVLGASRLATQGQAVSNTGGHLARARRFQKALYYRLSVRQKHLHQGRGNFKAMRAIATVFFIEELIDVYEPQAERCFHAIAEVFSNRLFVATNTRPSKMRTIRNVFRRQPAAWTQLLDAVGDLRPESIDTSIAQLHFVVLAAIVGTLCVPTARIDWKTHARRVVRDEPSNRLEDAVAALWELVKPPRRVIP